MKVVQPGSPLLLKSTLVSLQSVQINRKSLINQTVIKVEGVLCVPISYGCSLDLDTSLVKLGDLTSRVSYLLAQNSPCPTILAQIRKEALLLQDEFVDWANIQSSWWQPATFGVVLEGAAGISGCAYCHSGPIHTYSDCKPDLENTIAQSPLANYQDHVAAVWNTFRKSQLQHIDILVRLARLLSHEATIPALEERARGLVADMISSIPYHLAYDMTEYLKLVEGGAPAIPPNRPVGGLLLLHPLYAAARSPVVSVPTRLYLSKVLVWIGEQMGIGQADLLAQSAKAGDSEEKGSKATMPFREMSDGHMLIWAGMLLQPT